MEGKASVLQLDIVKKNAFKDYQVVGGLSGTEEQCERVIMLALAMKRRALQISKTNPFEAQVEIHVGITSGKLLNLLLRDRLCTCLFSSRIKCMQILTSRLGLVKCTCLCLCVCSWLLWTCVHERDLISCVKTNAKSVSQCVLFVSLHLLVWRI